MSTDRLAVASVLERIADFLEFRDENPFRIRAFRTAAKAVMSLPQGAAEALADGSLAATRGIGQATLAIIKEWLATGRSEYLEQLRQETPAGLLEMLGIPGLGPARVRQVHAQIGVQTLGELEAAARDGRLAALPGFGAKTAEKVLRGIEFARGKQAFRLSHTAAAEAEVLRSALERLPEVASAVIAGELRRGCELVSELALVVVTDVGPEGIREAIAVLPGMAVMSSSDATVVPCSSEGGQIAKVRITTAEHRGAALVQATGSASHLRQLEARARSAGFVLEAGLLLRGGAPVSTPDEAALFGALGLAEIPPELREGRDEVARAADGTLPRLIETADLVGFIHCHTTYSDGALGVRELAAACRDAGYAYVGITDHSKSSAFAGGLSLDRVAQQWEEIDALGAGLPGIRVLKGIEADILVDGSLDYDDRTLAGFDFVIGSIHSRMSLGEAEMTARVLRALENPYLTILGHPTGRQLLARRPVAMDLDRVFDQAATNGIALEINGDPHRLDLDWRLVIRARERGVVFAIGADAHSRADFAYAASGVRIARKGGLEKADVLNTRPLEEFLAFAQARRR